jgi:hypothetical protein
MNRNKQRRALAAKRNIGFADLAEMPAIPITKEEPAAEAPQWTGIVKVQYAQLGAEAYLVHNEDGSVRHEFKRSNYSRADWAGVQKAFGTAPTAFMHAVLHANGALEVMQRAPWQVW